ncbi:hypothetical protein [Agromyces bauzanensis]
MTQVARRERKPTGQDWLGEVPESWSLSPLGSHFIERKETVSDRDYRPLSVTKDGVVPQLATAAKTDNNDSRKLVRLGDFAINSRSDRKGSAGISHLDGSVSVVYTVLTPRPTIDARFAHYLLRSGAFQEEYYRWGSGIVADLWSTRYSAMKSIVVAVPPVDEQRAIADYLDRETAQIDTLIAKQEQLIATLRERRQSVIDGAFLPSKDNRPVRLRNILVAKPTYGVLVPIYVEADDSVPFIRVGDLGSINAVSPLAQISAAQSAEYSRTRLLGGEVLLGVVGRMGQVAIAPQRLAGANVARAVAVLRCTDPANSALAAIWLTSTLFLDQAGLATSGDSVQPTLGMRDLASFNLQWPKDSEVCARVLSDLQDQIAAIDALKAKAERFVEISKERRAALITAAVTGQIDATGRAN